MRRCSSSDPPPPPAPKISHRHPPRSAKAPCVDSTFVARQTPSAADRSLGVKMLDGRVLGLSPHEVLLHTTLRHFLLYTI